MVKFVERDVNQIIRGEKITAIIISIFFLLFYLYFQSSSIYGGDAGDLVTAAYVGGVAHPPGYPLYTFIGWILTKIPYSTIAWRVSLLSSIPAAISLGVLFLIIIKFTKSKLVSLISVTTLGFSYLYFLYAITPEVFSLFILLVTLIIWLSLQIENASITKLPKYYYLLLFITGLSLTHHHVVIFIIPAVIYYLYPYIKKIYKQNQNKSIFYLKSAGVFILGLLPYIYVYISASTQPLINWENPVTISGFIRLVTRSIYGSFRSNSIFNLGMSYRFTQLFFFIKGFILDFTYLGVVLAIIGLVFLYKSDNKLFKYTTFAFLLSGPVYFFYAGFPAFSNFQLGSIERFLLLPFLFFIIWMSIGIRTCLRVINSLFQRYTRNIRMNTIYLFILLPGILLLSNIWKMQPLKNDRTAENLGWDIINSVPDNSIILLSGDTALFNTEYVYLTDYSNINNKNKIIIAASMLQYNFYQEVLRKHYPQLKFPDNQNREYSWLSNFIDLNVNNFGIYATHKLAIGEKYLWMPHGLLLKLYNSNKIPYSEIKTVNENLFPKYHDPLSGALSQYNHLVLTDVNNLYANGYLEAGKIMLIGQDFNLAEKYLSESNKLQPKIYDTIVKLTQAQINKGECGIAKENITLLLKNNLLDNEFNLTNAIYYKICENNPEKASEYEVKYKSSVN